VGRGVDGLYSRQAGGSKGRGGRGSRAMVSLCGGAHEGGSAADD
jgi:hypothetical protein